MWDEKNMNYKKMKIKFISFSLASSVVGLMKNIVSFNSELKVFFYSKI